MLNQMISARSLRKIISRRDFIKYGLDWEKGKIDTNLANLLASYSSSNHQFSNPTLTRIKSKPVYLIKNPLDGLITKKINDNIKRLYKIRQASRDIIVKQLASLFCERTPFAVIKLDVSNFYESIDRKALFTKIHSDSLLSIESKLLLNKLLNETNLASPTGLPRGISLSATLSEVYMREFDSKVRQIDGVYYYARFVDDIIILVHSNPTTIKKKVYEALPGGLTFNKNKSTSIHYMPCKNRFEYAMKKSRSCPRKNICKDNSKIRRVDYLGYRFEFSCADIDLDMQNNVVIRLTPKKVAKIKSRIVLALYSFVNNRNESLLESRIKFLTGNYRVRQEKDIGTIKAGIYYNYKSITSLCDLSDLNVFLQKSITSTKGILGEALHSSLSSTAKQSILKYSFKSGFQNKIMHNFSSADLKLIKECWK